MEKIKISPSRVDIAKLGQGEVDEPDVTGGYIIKKDKDPTNQYINITGTDQNYIKTTNLKQFPQLPTLLFLILPLLLFSTALLFASFVLQPRQFHFE